MNGFNTIEMELCIMNKISNLIFVFTEDSFRVDRPKENVGKYEELKKFIFKRQI